MDLNLEVDVLFESSIDLIRCKLSQTLLKEVDSKFDVKVFFVEVVYVLLKDSDWLKNMKGVKNEPFPDHEE